MCLNELSARSRLRTCHPLEGLMLGGGSLLLALSATRIAPLLLLAASILLLTFLVARPPWRVYLPLAGGSLPFLLLTGLAISVSLSPTGLSWSEQNFGQSILVSVRAFTCALCSLFLAFAHPPASWTFLLSRLPLPSAFHDLTAYSLQTVYVLVDRAWHMLLAQRARGGHHHWRASLRSFSMLAARLLQTSMADLRAWHIGISARGGAGQVRTLSFLPQPRWAFLLGTAAWHTLMLLAMRTGELA